MAEKVKWIQYGTGVITFIGVLLTGVLWYDRGGAIVHAEDEAECAAAAWERSVVPFLFGTAPPALTVTNIITAGVTNYYCTVTISRLSGSAGPVCTFYGGVTNYTFTPDNWDTPIGLSFSYNEEGFVEGEPPANTVFRFSAPGYADVDVTVDMGFPVSYGEFTTEGMIKVREWYKYQALADIADQVSLHTSPTNSPTYTVVVTTNTYNWAGAIYKIDPYLRKGSDNSATKGIQSIASLLRRTALYTGPDAVRWLDTDEDLPAHGDTIASGTAYWTNSSAYDNYGQMVNVYTVIASNYTDTAVGVATITPAAYKWYWSANSNYYDMDRGAEYDVPNASSNSFPLGSLFGFTSVGASGLAEAALTGNWWSRNDLGSNVWRYGYEYLTPSNDVLPGIGEVRYIRRSSFATTNIFNEMKTLAEGMTRTIAVVPASEVTWTSRTLYAIDQAEGVESSTNGTTASYPTDWGASESAAYTAGSVTTTNPVGGGSGIEAPYALIVSQWQALLSGDKLNGEETWTWTWQRTWAASRRFEAVHYRGCVLPYPSMFALTNNHVAAITVYSVARVATTYEDSLTTYYTNTSASSTIVYSETSPDPSEYNDKGFGYAEFVCGMPAFLPSASSSSASVCDVPEGAFYEARVNLVGTWANPVVPPSFDFGSDGVYEDPPVTDYAIKETFEIEILPNGDQSQYISDNHTMVGEIGITVPYFVVVVDWKWKHFNPVTPFVPTNFVPEWITGNTNKPHVN